MADSAGILTKIEESSDLKYAISINLTGKCFIKMHEDKLKHENFTQSNVINRASCLIAMHLNSKQEFTQQTQFILAMLIKEFCFNNVEQKFSGYTLFRIEEKCLSELKSVGCSESLTRFMDNGFPFIIFYNFQLHISTFLKVDGAKYLYNNSIPIQRDDLLIDIFKGLQRQFASIGKFDFEKLSSFVFADMPLRQYPPLLDELTAEFKNNLKVNDIHDVE